MNQLKKNLSNITESTTNNRNLLSYVHNKANAKLGDSLVNFLYSIAKSLVSGSPTGIKVSDSILSESYKCSQWFKTKTLTLSGNKGQIADSIEALVLYFWIQESMTIEELIKPIVSNLHADNLHHPKEERKSAIQAFQKFLDYLFDFYSKK